MLRKRVPKRRNLQWPTSSALDDEVHPDDPNDTRMLAVGTTGLASGADTSTALEYLYNPIPSGLGAPIPF